MKKISFCLVTLAGLSGTGCDQFEYNVYETNRYEIPVEASNAYNLGRILEIPHKDTLRLIFTGDTQRYYNDLKDMVSAINTVQDVDAVFVAGDLVEFAVSKEFEWVCEELIKLRAPFLTVIGNHDILANGIEVYTSIFGPLNYAFTWNGIRFIMHNTNSREFGFDETAPDLDWMRQQLSDTNNYDYSLFVSHVPPYHDDFDSSLEPAYTQLVREAKNPVMVAHGHRHNHILGKPYNDEVWYLNTSSPQKRYFAYVTIYTHPDAEKRFSCTFVHF